MNLGHPRSRPLEHRHHVRRNRLDTHDDDQGSGTAYDNDVATVSRTTQGARVRLSQWTGPISGGHPGDVPSQPGGVRHGHGRLLRGGVYRMKYTRECLLDMISRRLKLSIC
jgi:hypothetical protein